MSPKRRPTTDKRDKRFEIRLSETTAKILEECSEKLNISKAEVVHKGILLVEKGIKKWACCTPSKETNKLITDRNTPIVNIILRLGTSVKLN